MMELILIKTVSGLGKLGDFVHVKNGYALNFLLPTQRALRATEENIQYFNSKKESLIEENLKSLQDVQAIYDSINKTSLLFIRQASESGHLYGGVHPLDVSEVLSEKLKKTIHKNQIKITQTIKSVGLFPIKIILHPELQAEIILNVAINKDEAKKQMKQNSDLSIDSDANNPSTNNTSTSKP